MAVREWVMVKKFGYYMMLGYQIPMQAESFSTKGYLLRLQQPMGSLILTRVGGTLAGLINASTPPPLDAQFIIAQPFCTTPQADTFV